MGIEVSRIEKEFILGTVADKTMELRVTGNKIEHACSIARIEEEFLFLHFAEGVPGSYAVGSSLSAYFSYYDHVMTFSSTIRAIEGDMLRVDMPASLYKNLSRKYARIPAPVDATVSFTVQETRVELGFPKTEEYDPVEVPALAEEFDLRHIESLIEEFREKTRRKASVNTVIMFRDRKPRGFEEKIISQTGKILFIPSTSGRFPENDFQMGGRIITRAMLLRPDLRNPSDEFAQDRLPSLLAEKKQNGILAEMYCPILFHEYAVGYIHLAQDKEMEGAFDHDLLDFCYQFSKVLAYSLKINGYFKEIISEDDDFQGEIIDVSASGILFCNASERLRSKLLLYTDLELLLQFGDRKLRVGGRVMRKYQSSDLTYYGLQFMEIKPEDFRFLFEYVYGRAIRRSDEDLWEGGAAPPALNL